jgi:hypothetical protein
MHVMLHIFKKDVRRLWWAVLATWVLLAALAQQDRWRADYIVGSTEGWLNLLLPLAWCCLIALLVNEEPLVDDREFWMTRPYRWPTLLGSKLLFVATLIHVPYFIACAAILGLRGFQPLAWLPQLFWKQVLLAAVLTLPAIALAAVLKNIAQFLLAALVILGAAVYLEGVARPGGYPLPFDAIRYTLAAGVLAVAACVLLPLQYARRRTVASRIAGAIAVIAAGLLIGYFPRTTGFRAEAALHPANQQVSLQLLPPALAPRFPGFGFGTGATAIYLPVEVPGVSNNPSVEASLIALEMTGPTGLHYQTPAPTAVRNFENIDLDANLNFVAPPYWLGLRMRRSAYEQHKDELLHLKGSAVFAFGKHGATTWTPANGNRDIPGSGHCSTIVVEGPNLYEQAALKVLCESPGPLPARGDLRLLDPVTGRDWREHLLRGSVYNLSGPRDSWLSPLNRIDTYFHLTSQRVPQPPLAIRYLIPYESLETDQLAITPYEVTGWAVVDFDFPNIRLSDYVKPPSH